VLESELPHAAIGMRASAGVERCARETPAQVSSIALQLMAARRSIEKKHRNRIDAGIP
jgi:hypothetical protein